MAANLIASARALDASGSNALPPAIEETDFHDFDLDQAMLGRLLFYDPILSGNRNISCGTCHHHDLAGTDRLSLGLGEGGTGVGTDRIAPGGDRKIKRRMARNSPALFNLGARSITTLFHDGRVSLDDLYENGFNTPAEEFLPSGLNGILAAQALFPLVGEIEMGGSPEENEVAAATNERIDYGWPLLVARVQQIEEYGPLFDQAFDEIETAGDIEIQHIANAIEAFIGLEWQSFDSPFDQYLRGDRSALTVQQKSGMNLFFGKGGCSNCHSGKFLTDQGFHALALPPLGPGRNRKFDLVARDVGRMGVSDRLEDAYRFRTPALRNVELTAPYGHNGTYLTLEGIIRHHLAPVESLDRWDASQTVLPDVPWLNASDNLPIGNEIEMAKLRQYVDIDPIELSDGEVEELVEFLRALTGEESVRGRLGRPSSVPSGLHVD